jgi:hypothetical protein
MVWRVWLCIQGQITYNCLNFYSLRFSIMLNNEPISVFILYVNRVNNPHSQFCVVLNANRILQFYQKREDIPCNSQTNTLSYPSFWTFVADYNHRKALSLLLSLLLLIILVECLQTTWNRWFHTAISDFLVSTLWSQWLSSRIVVHLFRFQFNLIFNVKTVQKWRDKTCALCTSSIMEASCFENICFVVHWDFCSTETL